MTVVNLPLDSSQIQLADDDDHVFWKQIIPMDREIVYGNQKIKFSRPLLEQLKSNYDRRLMDQTAFQLADDENRHDSPEDLAKERNWDPQRYRGEVQETKITDSGFWGKIRVTDDGLKIIKNNPKLGVSASIKPEWTDETGKQHKWVLRHVVGTLNPKIKGMSPWQQGSITLSATDDENEEVFDLTTVEESTKNQEVSNQVTLSREEYDRMKSAIDEFANGEALLDEILAEEDDDEVDVNLSDSTPAKDPAIVALENRVAASDWRSERKDYVAAGVPAAMLNLCDDVMAVADAPVINLSDGATKDPREVIRGILNEAKGFIDLSDENGHGRTPDERKVEADAAETYADGFINEFNLGLF